MDQPSPAPPSLQALAQPPNPINAGLTSEDARQRLAQGGANAIADVAQHPLQCAVGKLWAPVTWMLEAAIVLQLGLGD